MFFLQFVRPLRASELRRISDILLLRASEGSSLTRAPSALVISLVACLPFLFTLDSPLTRSRSISLPAWDFVSSAFCFVSLATNAPIFHQEGHLSLSFETAIHKFAFSLKHRRQAKGKHDMIREQLCPKPWRILSLQITTRQINCVLYQQRY